LLEARTYRFVGHSRSDPGRYRPPGELEAWQQRDPLILCRSGLERSGLAPGELDDLEAEVSAELGLARTQGLASPWPDALSLPAEFASVSE
jgi:TPP-dependent pyruvate/acetoin dehydrogenase alpha subunit